MMINYKFKLFIIFVFILFTFQINIVTALRCYTCSYTATSGDPKCIDNPRDLDGQNIVTCSKKYCTILRQETVNPEKVNTFLRGCDESPVFLNDVIEDPTFKTFYRSCTTDLCNDGDGKKSGGPSISADGETKINLELPGLVSNANKLLYSFTIIILSAIILYSF